MFRFTSLCFGFLREVIVYSAYNVIQRYNAYSSNNMDKLPVIKEHNLFHARNLCNSEVFHVFLGKDVVYALRYPYYQRLSCEAKMTSLTNGSGENLPSQLFTHVSTGPTVQRFILRIRKFYQTGFLRSICRRVTSGKLWT